MKNKPWLSYLLLISQAGVLLGALTVFINSHISYTIIYRTVKYHVAIEVVLSVFLIYSVRHYILTVRASSVMRKEAGKKREIKSKRIELLIFFLMISLIFHSLFMTVPMNKYLLSTIEWVLMLINCLLQFIMLIKLISTHEGVSEDFVKSKQKYAGVGAFFGLALFYTYFILLN
ncbi:MAG: hypothetical protein RLO81_13495 [Fulvivirga sp.]|uniref:hypothetical protein n=1 Tax=Fulvivirga sp. TaxID=1931237 RepID=UPI0032EC284C